MGQSKEYWAGWGVWTQDKVPRYSWDELDKLNGVCLLVKAGADHTQCCKPAETKRCPKGTKMMLLLHVWPLYVENALKRAGGTIIQ